VAIPPVAPAFLLSLVVGVFHSLLWLLLVGRLRLSLVLLVPAAILGAFVGQALGNHLGDPVQVGDYHLLWASAMSWVGILIVAGLAWLVPPRERIRDQDGKQAP
jgi:hypothetical protein